VPTDVVTAQGKVCLKRQHPSHIPSASGTCSAVTPKSPSPLAPQSYLGSDGSFPELTVFESAQDVKIGWVVECLRSTRVVGR
jgi:hypothetical protein